MDHLTKLRGEIDRCNAILLEVLNERAKVAIEIGKVKMSMGIPIHDSARETKILEQLTEMNGGPLTNQMIEKIFAEIIKANRQIQHP